MKSAFGGTLTGIVFSGGKGPPPGIIRAHIDELSGTCLIAAADSGLETAEKAGLKPDWIVGDMDSLSDPSRLDAYSAAQVLRYPRDKNYTDTELAFSLLSEKGCNEIWIAGGGGGRVDHLFGIRSMCERKVFPARWILDTADVFCVEAGKGFALPFTRHLEKNALVSVLPLGEGPWRASSRGLKWPLDNVIWDRGFIGVSNAAPDGEFLLNAEQGRFMGIIPRNSEERVLFQQ